MKLYDIQISKQMFTFFVFLCILKMVRFMESYIIKTYQDGSQVTVRDVQKVILEIAKVVDQICEKHHIPYIVNGGTALGVIRHQGFIPWDDDFDMAILRKDYKRFIKALQEDLPEDYTFHCFETDQRYNVTLPAMKIRKKNTYLKERNLLLPNKCDDCDGVFIDVFLYNYVSENKFIDYPFRFVNKYLLMPIIVLLENLHFNPKLLKKAFIKNGIIYGNLCKKMNSTYIGNELTWVYRKMSRATKYRIDDIFPTKKMKFEDTVLSVAHHEKAQIIADIGPDYMTLPPENKRFSKHILDINLDGDQPKK